MKNCEILCLILLYYPLIFETFGLFQIIFSSSYKCSLSLNIYDLSELVLPPLLPCLYACTYKKSERIKLSTKTTLGLCITNQEM